MRLMLGPKTAAEKVVEIERFAEYGVRLLEAEAKLLQHHNDDAAAQYAEAFNIVESTKFALGMLPIEPGPITPEQAGFLMDRRRLKAREPAA